MNPIKITATANVAAPLLPADTGRNGARIENPLSSPIYVDQATTPTMGPPTITVPAADPFGNPGWYVFDGSCHQAWYYKTAASGAFTIHWW